MGSYREEYSSFIQNREDFWKEKADLIQWYKKPEKILSKTEEDLYRWFEGGTLNTCYLAVDYHVENGRKDQTALIYDSPVTNTKKKYTYGELQK